LASQLWAGLAFEGWVLLLSFEPNEAAPAAPAQRRRGPVSSPPPIVVASTEGGEFEADPLEAGQLIAGSPGPRDRSLGQWSDGTVTGIWRCGPGRFRDVEVDETFVVLEGRASIEHDGTFHEVGPGDVCVLPEGAETVWTVHESLLKVYLLRPG
jgi:uncharacterized cupin superfamily protein